MMPALPNVAVCPFILHIMWLFFCEHWIFFNDNNNIIILLCLSVSSGMNLG